MTTNLIVIVLLLSGCFFFIVGTVGVLRLPDVFSRLHPSTLCDTLGAGSVLLAMAIYGGWPNDIFRLALIGFFLLISSAVCGHAIGRSAIKSGLKCYQVKTETAASRLSDKEGSPRL